MRYMADQARGIAYRLFERVNIERAEQGWTWTRLQERSGVARSTIYSWAKIITPPQPGTVNAVADVLGIPRAEALTLAGILTDGAQWECLFEAFLAERISDPVQLRLRVEAHRRVGHSPDCLPAEEDQKPSSALIASL